MELTCAVSIIVYLSTNLFVVTHGSLTRKIILEQGTLRGFKSFVNNYEYFLGIPYASVYERFKEAGEPPTWNGTFIASHGKIQCYQYSTNLNKPVGQKDCLIVNIFKPICTNKSDLLPVMVFFHGGGFFSDSNSIATYNPKHFVKKRVIVVTINYRLGAFGFLCLTGTQAVGNIGLKDQLLALKWIKNNIKAFDGDSNSITVFGESSGAASVHFLILSQQYKDVFQKAILQSGSALEATMFDNKPLKTASFIASRMGYNTTDPREILTIFQNATASEIINASYINRKNNALGQYLFRPCAEDTDQVKTPLITTNPRNLLKKFNADNNLKMIVGFNNKEGILWAGAYNSSGLDKLNQNFEQIIPENIIFTGPEERFKLAEKVKTKYFQNSVVTNNNDGLINFFTDTIVAYPETVSCRNFMQKNVTLYNYYFKYDSNRNVYKFETGLPNRKGASHGDILGYEFDSDKTSHTRPTGKDRDIIDLVTTLFTNFAKSGTPTANHVNWTSNKENDIKFLDIAKEIKIIPMPIEDRMVFWDEIYNEYGSY